MALERVWVFAEVLDGQPITAALELLCKRAAETPGRSRPMARNICHSRWSITLPRGARVLKSVIGTQNSAAAMIRRRSGTSISRSMPVSTSR